MKSLAKHPDERYQSADEMRADLERALDGRPVAAAPTVAAGFGAPAPTAVMAPSAGGRGYGGPGGYGSAASQTRYDPAAYQSGEDSGPVDEVPRSRRAPSGTGGRKASKKDNTGWVIMAVVVVVALVLVGVVYETVFSGGTGTVGTVPTITGQTVAVAQKTLEDSKYKLGAVSCAKGEQNSNAIKAGLIVGQNPQPGQTANTGTAVSYCVSAGPVQYGLPASVTQSSGTATVNQLKSYGFVNVTTQTKTDGQVPMGNAIDIVDANGNSQLGKKVPVTMPLVVLVSGGPGATTVPSVVNQSCAQAQQTLQGAPYNFQISTTNQYSTDGIPANNAIGTNPTANAPATIGQAVTLYCSQGASPPATTPTTATPTPTDTTGFIGGFNGGGGGN